MDTPRTIQQKITKIESDMKQWEEKISKAKDYLARVRVDLREFEENKKKRESERDAFKGQLDNWCQQRLQDIARIFEDEEQSISSAPAAPVQT